MACAERNAGNRISPGDPNDAVRVAVKKKRDDHCNAFTDLSIGTAIERRYACDRHGGR
jgi:hypothetical protein